ncbi:MAG: glutathione peroxidase [Planctomycetota bacterium]|nr:glutathione peroxidase [Planctomycetota bacterium]
MKTTNPASTTSSNLASSNLASLARPLGSPTFAKLAIGLAACVAASPLAPALASPAGSAPADQSPARQAPTPTPYMLDFTMKQIDGKDLQLSAFKGRVLMLVNVASACGLTKQYAGLQKLYADKKDEGFVILGFPANEFGGQEPGTNAEIAAFCSSKFNVTFPMFEKIVVKGDDVHPLYARLIQQPAPIGGEPKWNFTKFLVDRSGNVVARFEPRVTPDDPALIKKIEELLAQPVPAGSQPDSSKPESAKPEPVKPEPAKPASDQSKPVAPEKPVAPKGG